MIVSILNVVGLFVLMFVVFGIYVAIEAYYYQGRIGSELQRDLGFRDSTAYYRNGRRLESIVAIRDVDQQGAFYRAGFREGDVFPKESHTSLFKKLHRKRGREVELEVVTGGAGPSYYERPRRVIRFCVPAQSHLRSIA